MPTSGEGTPKEGGLRPGGEGRSTDPEKNGQMGQEAQRLPRRDPQGVARLLLLEEAKKGTSRRRTQTSTDEILHRRDRGERREIIL